ncbi:MAG TPA: AMP-binding protein, partial [Burkholderiaceae bacterium]|nr:AMP-binding protein [Burkholderiaceae bacterium]
SANLFRALVDGGTPRVALLLPPLPEAWFALWGAETAGIACPINHALSDEHLVALLNAAQVNLVVTLAPGHAAGDIGARVRRLRPSCPTLRAVLAVGGASDGCLDFDAERALQPGDSLAFEVPAVLDGIVALFHTGGTTGLPKLAQHTFANQLHAAWGAARLYDSTEHDVILNGFPLFHVAGAFVYGLSMLLSGAEVVLPPPAGFRDAAFVARAWSVIRERGVTLLAMVPTVMSALLAAPRAGADAQGVRLGLTGGSPLPTELANRFEAEIGVPVRNILGMTECAGVIAIEPARASRTPGSCGLPLPFSEVQVDGDGVLRLRGPNVGPGYTDAHRNAGSFEGEWLVTGDIGEVDAQGRVFVTGRAKDVIIRGAHNIDPGVIEEALLQHPSVVLAAAVGEPDEYAGELPVAFVVVRPGAAFDEAELLAFATPHIPERAAVPKRIECLPALPLTAIGKVYKPALRLRATERVLRDRLRRAGLESRVQVQGEDRSGQLVMRFNGAAGGSDAGSDVRAELREVMAGFALAWELD